MPIINKPSFIELINSINNLTIQNEDRPAYYLGMGNPNSDILIVGKEKALDLNDEVYYPIINHESLLNINHWTDLIQNYNNLEDPFHNILLQRIGNLNGFNPFSPLLFPQIANIVHHNGGHTYQKISYLISLVYPVTNLFENILFENSIFSKFFLTEINHTPALNNANFNLTNFMNGPRYNFMSASDFYKSFRIVIVHVGLNSPKYIGSRFSVGRYQLLRSLFNKNLENNPQTLNLGENNNGQIQADLYTADVGANIIVCNQLSGSAGWTNNSLIQLSEEIQNLIR